MKTVTYASITEDIDLDVNEGMQMIRVGGAGDLALEFPDGTSDTIVGIAAGEVLYVKPSKIVDTGTTATALTLFWFDRPLLTTAGSNPSASTINPDHLTQLEWYIDADAGNDTNDGSELSPLASWAELSRRWGTFNVVGTENAIVTVFLKTDLPASDPIDFQVTLGPSVSILIKGLATTIDTGTLSAVTLKDRPTNQALEITDVGTTWSAFMPAGATPARILDSTNGSVFFVSKDLGSGVARCSEPIVPFEDMDDRGFAAPSLDDRPADPVSIGDTWEAQSLTKAYIGNVRVNSNLHSTTPNGSANNVAFQDLFIKRAASTNPAFSVDAPSNVTVQFAGCILEKRYIPSAPSLLSYSCSRRGFIGYGGLLTLSASLIHGSCGFRSMGVNVDMDTIFQGGVSGPGIPPNNGICGSNCSIRIGTAGVFDVTPGVNNPVGSGAFVSAGTSCSVADQDDELHALWGSGNADAGVAVGAGSTFLYDTNMPTITGTGGDFALAGATSSRAWDETAGAGAGAWTALITNTWAHLASSIGTGGLGEAAVNVGKNAVITNGN